MRPSSPGVLAAARLLDSLPLEICLLASQPHLLEPGLELSAILQARLDAFLKQILAELEG